MTKAFRLKGLGCANCASKMENSIKKIDGVEDAVVNFMTAKLIIEAEEDKMQDILEKAQKIIKKIETDCMIVKI